MIKNVFYGAVYRSGVLSNIVSEGQIIPDGKGITVYTPDLSSIGNPMKLDILYYNNINRYGEVLSSIVYISDVRSASSTSEIYYIPTNLLNNSQLEQSQTVVSGASTRWLNADILQNRMVVLNDTSRGATHTYAKFDVNSSYAPQVSSGKYMYDGWYSMVSVAPESLPNISPDTKAGTLRHKSGDIQYANIANPTLASHWTSISNIVDTVPIANLIRNGDPVNPYIKVDFLIIMMSNTLYNGLTTKAMNSEWFTGIEAIRPKMRTIYSSVYNEDFATAQFLINSINLTLLSIII